VRHLALLVAALSIAGCPKEAAPPPKIADAAPAPDAEPPPKPNFPAALPAVEGASADNGKKIYLSVCAGCHGADGQNPGTQAADLRIAPTDLTTPRYLCRSTVGRPVAVPSDQDVETAIDRGTHRKFKEIVGLDAASRRSLLLFLRSLSSEFNRDPLPLAPVPPESADSPESRRRGRIAYLAFGCWQCHGSEGKGDGSALSLLGWNGRKLKSIRPLAERDQYLCGSSPERTYVTLAIGMGSGLMPAYQEFAENIARPETDPREWDKSLKGKVPIEDSTAVRGWYGELPEKVFVRGMKPSQKRERAAQYLWDIVHYLRSL
jgi:mono/diheme cytochrome c family protein